MRRFLKNSWKYLVTIALITVLGTLAIAWLKPEEVAADPPDYLQVQEYDIADYGGEMGRLYVVRAEWVYLSRESAEAKRREIDGK